MTIIFFISSRQSPHHPQLVVIETREFFLFASSATADLESLFKFPKVNSAVKTIFNSVPAILMLSTQLVVARNKLIDYFPSFVSFFPDFSAILSGFKYGRSFYFLIAFLSMSLYYLSVLQRTFSLRPKQLILPKFYLWTFLCSTITYFSTGRRAHPIQRVTALDSQVFTFGGFLYAPLKASLILYLLSLKRNSLIKQITFAVSMSLLPVLNFILARILPPVRIHVRDTLPYINARPINYETNFYRIYQFSLPSWTIMNGVAYLMLADNCTCSSTNSTIVHLVPLTYQITYCIYSLPIYSMRPPSIMESSVALFVILGIYGVAANFSHFFPRFFPNEPWFGLYFF